MAKEQRFIYGEDAELYDRARPSYPAQLIDDVVGLVGDRAVALDAGCGTGKAAVLLAARVLRGVGVEADAAMAAVARRNLAPRPGWRVDVSTFEDWSPTPGDIPFDLVVSAQAWHWFAPEAAFRKVRSLLKPGGWLALWWTGPADFDSPARRAIDRAYSRHAPDIPYRGVSGHGRPDVGPLPAGVTFDQPLERDYAWLQEYSSTAWIDLLRTSSDHRMLPAEIREPLLEAVAEAIEAHGGTYQHPYICRLWAAQRL